MALTEQLRAEIFRNATLNLGFRSHGVEWEPDALRNSATSLRELARLAPLGVDNIDDKLVAVVDEVMRGFYPHNGRWDNPHLCEFLIKNADMLELAAADMPVNKGELQALNDFCKEMWITLSAFEMKKYRGT